MKLMRTNNRGLGRRQGAWKVLAAGGGMGFQIRQETETYLTLGISNNRRIYELRISPKRIKALRVECDQFLKELERLGWDL